MQIVSIKIEEIQPYENNPRENDYAVPAVANSIREFGFRSPCIVDSENVLIAGHTRLKAANMLGIKEIPCIVVDDLTEEQITAFRLADNKVSELADWDFEKLNEELEKIINIDMEGFGFNGDDFFEQNKDQALDLDEMNNSNKKQKKNYCCPKCGFEFEVTDG